MINYLIAHKQIHSHKGIDFTIYFKDHESRQGFYFSHFCPEIGYLRRLIHRVNNEILLKETTGSLISWLPKEE